MQLSYGSTNVGEQERSDTHLFTHHTTSKPHFVMVWLRIVVVL